MNGNSNRVGGVVTIYVLVQGPALWRVSYLAIGCGTRLWHRNHDTEARHSCLGATARRKPLPSASSDGRLSILLIRAETIAKFNAAWASRFQRGQRAQLARRMQACARALDCWVPTTQRHRITGLPVPLPCLAPALSKWCATPGHRYPPRA